MNKFIDLGITGELAAALEKIKITEPMKVQSEAIPPAIEGRHVCACAPTGTGKTLAYLLPAIQLLDAERPVIQAVIVAPTQELAMQIFRQAGDLLRDSGNKARAASLIGGANIARQIDKLKAKPQLIVGSTNRIMELQRKGKVKLQNVKVLVLDEADRLLDDQRKTETEQLVRGLPQTCQYLLFSATLSEKTLARAAFLDDTVVKVNVTENAKVSDSVQHWYFLSDFRDKAENVRKLAKLLAVKRGLIFVNRNDEIEPLLKKLQYHGLSAAALTASADKMYRKKAMQDFTSGRIKLLIASDVAARGLDIADVDYVFHYGMPENEKVYLHRAGRTGRAGKAGTVISLAAQQEIPKLVDFSKKLNITMQPKKMNNGKIEDFIIRVAPHRSKANALQELVQKNSK